MKNTRRK